MWTAARCANSATTSERKRHARGLLMETRGTRRRPRAVTKGMAAGGGVGLKDSRLRGEGLASARYEGYGGALRVFFADWTFRDARLPYEAMHTVPHSNHRRLMVVDDDHDLVDALCELIGLCSEWTAIGAYGPADAIAQASETTPDAILLDMEMDGVDGFDTARRLVTAAGQKCPALFALTGNDRLRDVALLDGRFTASILKPADLNGLLKLLEKVSPAH